MLYKKSITFSVLLVIMHQSFGAQNIVNMAILRNQQRLIHPQGHQVPYENIIAQEYNRIRGGINHYVSIDAIMDQSLRGKSLDQKTLIIDDLKALRQSIAVAGQHAQQAGRRMWQWGYIWKDNSITIDTLSQLESDVSAQLARFEWESQSDMTKFLLYSSKYLATGVVAITALYLSQSYLLDKDAYKDNKKYGLFDLLGAPTAAGFDVIKNTTKAVLSGISYSLESLDKGAKFINRLLSDKGVDPEKE